MKLARGIWRGLKGRPRLAAGAAAATVLFVAAGGASSRQVVVERGPVEPDLLVVRFFSEASAGDDGPSVALDDLGRIRFVADAAAAEGEAEDAAGAPEAEAAPRPARLVVRRHTVGRGETLGGIAARHGIRLETLRAYNPEASARALRVGRVLEVPDRDGVPHKVARGQTLWEVARAYKVPVGAIVEANGLASAAEVRAGQRLFIPGARRTLSLDGGAAWGWPARGRLSSRYGLRKHPIWGRYVFHRGLDIAAGPGTPIRAAADGVVVYADWKGGYGRMVDVRHKDGTTTRYAHASRIEVRRGQRVSRGQVIARVGETGSTTGPHLHFEVRRNGRTVDPLPILAGR